MNGLLQLGIPEVVFGNFIDANYGGWAYPSSFAAKPCLLNITNRLS